MGRRRDGAKRRSKKVPGGKPGVGKSHKTGELVAETMQHEEVGEFRREHTKAYKRNRAVLRKAYLEGKLKNPIEMQWFGEKPRMQSQDNQRAKLDGIEVKLRKTRFDEFARWLDRIDGEIVSERGKQESERIRTKDRTLVEGVPSEWLLYDDAFKIAEQLNHKDVPFEMIEDIVACMK